MSFILNKSYSVQFHFMRSFTRAVLQCPLAAFLLLKLRNLSFFSIFSAAFLTPFFLLCSFKFLFLEQKWQEVHSVPDENSPMPYAIPLIYPISACPTLLVLLLPYSQAHYTGRLYLYRAIGLPSITIYTWWLSDLQQILINSP